MKMKFIAIFLSVFLALVTGLVHAQPFSGCTAGATDLSGIVKNIAPWYCSTVDPYVEAQWASWFPILILAVMISFSIAILLFIFGTAVKNDRLRTIGISEIYEALGTTIIVGFFVFISAVMFGLLPAITTGPINPFDASLSYMTSTINVTVSTSTRLFNVIALAAYYSTVGLQFRTGGGEFQSPPILAPLDFAIGINFFFPAWSVVSFMIEALFSLYTQFYLLIFTMYSAIPVFLIPGVLFRTFIPTRALGGSMIAIAVGFYFVMPTLFAVAYSITSNNIGTQLTSLNSAIGRYGENANFVANSNTANSPLAIAVSQVQNSFNSYWLSILFFPALIIATTYAMITQVAELIGGMSKGSSRLRALL